MALKRWALADELLEAGLADEPNDALLHGLRAEVCYRLADYEESYLEARLAIQHAPEWCYGYIWMGWVLLSGNYIPEDAAVRVEDVIDLALARDPQNPDVFEVAAVAARLANNTEKAQECALCGLQEDPHHFGCLMQLLYALHQQQRFEEALATTERLLTIAPEDAVVHRLKAQILLQMDRPADAFIHASKALHFEPNDRETFDVYHAAMERMRSFRPFEL